MQKEWSVFISLARWVSIAFTLIVAVLPPAGVFYAGYTRLEAELLGELELKGSFVREIINLDPEYWTFNDIRISEILSRTKKRDQFHCLSVTETSGSVVAQYPETEPVFVWPVLMVEKSLDDYAHEVGKLSITHSLKFVYLKAILTAALSSVLALILFWFLKVLPLRLMKESLNEIAYLATHDSLTGLANRTQFDDRLTSTLEKSRARKSPVAVFTLDLDRFKDVNDTLGHAAGDHLLIEVANRLKANIPKSDLPARIGGDEFVVLVQRPVDETALIERAKHLIEEISKPYLVSGQVASIGASIGISVAREPEEFDPIRIMRGADLALYRAKNEGRGICRMFREEMEFQQKQTRSVECALRSALTDDRFQLYYQPQFDAKSRRLVGAEALLRFDDTFLTNIGTQQCISIAESTDLIIPVSKWVLETACRHATLLDQLQIAVNVSPNLFRWQGLTDFVQERLTAYKLDGSRLEFEITEKVLIDDVDTAVQTLCDLQRLGVGIAMDDFGTGYSSLGYLRQFPFDKIKIDRAFIKDIGASREADAIVKAIIAMSDALGMKIVAEGVETEQQLQLIQREGNVDVQGYYFGRPMLFGQILQVMANDQTSDEVEKWAASAVS
ncbi:putative bifunctional diguanylate cyclase/phosphodiesterase [Roseibium sp.]|uniref:putative bifunctional diguanylate cyclase/phosphodiesterase n=1 Tax=Roseibium sp. TaxID=1936156 RepID=UPI003B52C65B